MWLWREHGMDWYSRQLITWVFTVSVCQDWLTNVMYRRSQQRVRRHYADKIAPGRGQACPYQRLPLEDLTNFSFFLMYENFVCRVSWHVSRSVDSTSKSGPAPVARGGRGGAPVAPHRRLNRPPPRNACALPIMEILLTHFYMSVHLDGRYPDMELGETGSMWTVEWWCVRFDIFEVSFVWLVLKAIFARIILPKWISTFVIFTAFDLCEFH